MRVPDWTNAVLDRVERAGDADLQPGLLLDLADGRLLAALAGVGRALGERPGPPVALAPAAADDEPRLARFVSNDDPAGGGGGRRSSGRPRRRRGARATDRAGAAGAGPLHGHQRTRTGRCAVASRTRGMDRAPAGPQAGQAARPPDRAAPSSEGPARVNEPDGRRPSRRSRTRVEGRTNRAAGRAAYLAAML